jgi:peroxiredoxin
MMKLSVYGSTTCEDTALVRARLRALNIPFASFDREEDARVDAVLEKWNHGNRITPTLIFGADEIVIAEPSIEMLEDTLRRAGYAFETPRAVSVGGERKNQRMRNFTLPASDGATVTLYKLGRGRRAVVLFVDDVNDRASQGYARQVTQPRADLEYYNAVPLFVVHADLETTTRWAHEFARGYAALSDADGRVHPQFAADLGVNVSDALLVILDAYCAPRAFSFAPNAGGLIAPNEILEWLRLLDCECDE